MTTTTAPATTSLNLTPFRVAVPENALADLRARLCGTRLPDHGTADTDWSHGTPIGYLRDMVAQCAEFDWRAVESRLNGHPQFTASIDGQTIHFLHVRSAHADATPLLLAHSYPGSVLDFLDMIEPLVAPEAHGGEAADAFHVVVPSLPGMGFSTPLSDGEWTMARAAAAYDTLMRGLGYPSYAAHGSDGGAMVAREIAAMVRPDFLGAHVLQLFSFPNGTPGEFDALGPQDYAALEFAGWFQSVAGYAQLNASRPATIAAALSDSPVGQLAYNELFESFGNGTSRVRPDQVLAQTSLQWLTNTSAGAVRYHHTERAASPRVNHGPIGITVFAHDFQSIRAFAERDNTRIVSWTTRPDAGHYAAMEAPLAVVEEIRAFVAGRRPAPGRAPRRGAAGLPSSEVGVGRD